MSETLLITLTIAAKFLFYVSSLQASGLALLHIIFSAELLPAIKQTRKQAHIWAVFCALSAIIYVGLIGFSLTEGLGSDAWPILKDYFAATGYDIALIVQIIACSALLLGGTIAGAGAVVLLGSFALVGHIGPSLFASVLVLHLIIGAIWFAVLAPLRRMAINPDLITEAAILGRSFGRLAQVFVPLSLGLGAVLAWSLAGSISALIETAYGWALLAKVGCSAGLLWAGAANKLRYVPGIEAGDTAASNSLARSVRIEQGLFILIFALTAALTTSLTPP